MNWNLMARRTGSAYAQGVLMASRNGPISISWPPRANPSRADGPSRTTCLLVERRSSVVRRRSERASRRIPTGIEDGNGLDRVQFRYQWVSHDESTDKDIASATGSTYTLAASDKGKTTQDTGCLHRQGRVRGVAEQRGDGNGNRRSQQPGHRSARPSPAPPRWARR